MKSEGNRRVPNCVPRDSALPIAEGLASGKPLRRESAVLFDRSHPAFRVAFKFGLFIKRQAEPISVMQQIPAIPRKLHGYVSGHLLHPLFIGMRSHSADLAALQM